jgi:predicted NBD/HSP70 family sugar kinase
VATRQSGPTRAGIGQRSETVRRANLSAIVRQLHLRGPLSRSALVAHTGLTRTAIRALISDLVAGGMASEGPAIQLGIPGRPSPIVRPDPTRFVLAVEIAVDSLAVATVGFGGAVFSRVRVERPRAHLSVDETVAELARLARVVLARRPAGEGPIGAGVAVVGVVRRSDGFVSMAPNLGWRDVPLGERLTQALGGRVPIRVANEADLGALAEWRRGAASGVDDLIFLSGEVGVGAGIIVGGRPLTGAAGYGGEVGHVTLDPAGAPCRCGSRGCWETTIGEDALLRLAGRPAGGGTLEIERVLAAADAGEPAAGAALEEVGRWLGSGLAGLVNVFDPSLIVLGGLLGRIHPYAGRIVEEQLDRLALPAPRGLVRIVPAALGTDAPLLGAAELAFEPLLADPAEWLGQREALAAMASA